MGLKVLRFSDREVFENIGAAWKGYGVICNLQNLPSPLFYKEGNNAGPPLAKGDRGGFFYTATIFKVRTSLSPLTKEKSPHGGMVFCIIELCLSHKTEGY